MRRQRVDLAERIEMLSKAVELSAGRVPDDVADHARTCLLYTSPSPRDV